MNDSKVIPPGPSLEHKLHMLGSATWTATQLHEIGLEARAKIADFEMRLAKVREMLETAVCVKEPDEGVILLSNEGQVHGEAIECAACVGTGKEISPLLEQPVCTRCSGVGSCVVSVYDHDYFSPLGDALIAAWKLTAAYKEKP